MRKFEANPVLPSWLYFEMTGGINKLQPNTTLNTQTSYIQINNTILSQENLKHLSAEQLNQVERIIMKQKVVQPTTNAN